MRKIIKVKETLPFIEGKKRISHRSKTIKGSLNKNSWMALKSKGV